jgi:hypothetical protein
MMDQKELIETLAMFRDHAIKCKARSETYAMAQYYNGQSDVLNKLIALVQAANRESAPCTQSES